MARDRAPRNGIARRRYLCNVAIISGVYHSVCSPYNRVIPVKERLADSALIAPAYQYPVYPPRLLSVEWPRERDIDVHYVFKYPAAAVGAFFGLVKTN